MKRSRLISTLLGANQGCAVELRPPPHSWQQAWLARLLSSELAARAAEVSFSRHCQVVGDRAIGVALHRQGTASPRRGRRVKLFLCTASVMAQLEPQPSWATAGCSKVQES